MEEYWPDMEGLDFRDTVTDEAMPPDTYFDVGMVHLLTTATIDRLRELNTGGRFEVRRFRPNIVIKPAEENTGFVENDWVDQTVTIGGAVQLKVTETTSRCVMTTLPQSDLPRDPGILRTVAKNNRVKVGVYADILKTGRICRLNTVSIG